MTVKGVSRRHFIRQTGALIITFSLSSQIRPSLAWAQSSLPRSLANQPELDAWIRISSDNTVTIFTGKVELGQGITTALAQIAAEELNLSLDQIEMVSGDTARTPDEGSTTGSRSIEVSGAAVRAAAAEARGILLDLAAQKLAVAPEKLEIKEGVIRPQGKTQPRVSYGELIGDRRFQRGESAVEGGLRISLVADDCWFGSQLSKIGKEVFSGRENPPWAPFRTGTQDLHRANCLFLPLGDDCDKVPISNHLNHTWHAVHLTHLQLFQAGTIAGGAQDAAMQHLR